MWLAQVYNLIQAHLQAIQEPLANAKECDDYAAAAYDYCSRLYGEPSDPHRPYDLLKGLGELSYCSYALGRYTIRISPDCLTLDEQCMVIGHEMYHRVTMHRKGLRSQVWIDELLAFLTSFWFLHQQGFSDYADSFADNCIGLTTKVNLKRLREIRRPPWYIRLKNLGLEYPEGFYAEVFRLAVALKEIVAGNDLCRILKAATIEQWIGSLPEEKQYSACRILEVSSDGKRIPHRQSDLSQFRSALKAKGDREAAISEFQEIARCQPANGIVFFYLARVYEEAEQIDAALDAYLNAHALNFSNCWLSNNIGNIYWHKKEYAVTAKWFQKAIQCKPDWAHAYYWRGEALNKLGDLAGARNEWAKALTLNDEHYAKLAQKELQENPLPLADIGPASS